MILREFFSFSFWRKVQLSWPIYILSSKLKRLKSLAMTFKKSVWAWKNLENFPWLAEIIMTGCRGKVPLGKNEIDFSHHSASFSWFTDEGRQTTTQIFLVFIFGYFKITTRHFTIRNAIRKAIFLPYSWPFSHLLMIEKFNWFPLSKLHNNTQSDHYVSYLFLAITNTLFKCTFNLWIYFYSSRDCANVLFRKFSLILFRGQIAQAANWKKTQRGKFLYLFVKEQFFVSWNFFEEINFHGKTG